ncbi:uncharacterized protein MONOS_4139 [Monocercomonoides exilis]|uniref:uncharacterized protein n=1 Tax=Monocercomonoides exilis TaxID=2049356 RepID=UPI0035597D41|nr:hypothetical protein MONOS_4139 [Monocercomonoides exilis]|eukprot:MONOS_4139.1-p1 / transcript=MONOS_4139.1 / gene=MONOS_4139 / organism=Monocercomonoides_exilis_PA203 / gene_product=unspecified product / transcript_product=unspecified product / location=Mono_scaffold00106:47499-48221(+) / protein_length=193 / sequence_SO=supercontig / SO=protein_coding / is_pseudo=false
MILLFLFVTLEHAQVQEACYTLSRTRGKAVVEGPNEPVAQNAPDKNELLNDLKPFSKGVIGFCIDIASKSVTKYNCSTSTGYVNDNEDPKKQCVCAENQSVSPEDLVNYPGVKSATWKCSQGVPVLFATKCRPKEEIEVEYTFRPNHGQCITSGQDTTWLAIGIAIIVIVFVCVLLSCLEWKVASETQIKKL